MPTPDIKHSYQLQQIIHRVPHWLLRWGISLLLILTLFLVGVCSLIRYPVVIQGPFTFKSESRRKAIRAKVDGMVLQLFVHEDQSVKQGQILSYLKSSANPNEMMTLSKIIDEFDMHPSMVRTQDLPMEIDSFRGLGAAQICFQNFISSYRGYKKSLQNEYCKERLNFLKNQLVQLVALQQNYERLERDDQQEYALSMQNYRASHKASQEKIIVPYELKESESELLSKKISLWNVRTALLENKKNQMRKQKEISELSKFMRGQENNFIQATNRLRSTIENWKLSYVLSAPHDGKVHFASFIQEHQYVTNGEELFYVLQDEGNVGKFGETLIPQEYTGKVRIGQRVMIKFKSYPFREYGYVQGRIAFISWLPSHDSSFVAKIELPNGLTTNYHRALLYKVGMIASAEIIIEDASLMQRFLHSLRGIQ